MTFLDGDISLSYPGGAGGFLLFYLILLEQRHDVEFQVYPFHVKKFIALYPEFFTKLRISEELYNSKKEPGFPEYKDYYENYALLSRRIADKLIRHHIQNPCNVNDFSEWRDFMLSEAIACQWDINNVNEWKWKEYWPSNSLDFVPRPGRHRLFKGVNEYDEWKQYPGAKLFLYTDIHTQVRMNLHKRSHWFYKPASNDRNINRSFVKRLLQNTTTFNSVTIHKAAEQCLLAADKTILLQDLLLDPIAVGLSNNDKQQELIGRWINLHKKFGLYSKVMKGYI